jgi:hypothetical protein
MSNCCFKFNNFKNPGAVVNNADVPPASIPFFIYNISDDLQLINDTIYEIVVYYNHQIAVEGLPDYTFATTTTGVWKISDIYQNYLRWVWPCFDYLIHKYPYEFPWLGITNKYDYVVWVIGTNWGVNLSNDNSAFNNALYDTWNQGTPGLSTLNNPITMTPFTSRRQKEILVGAFRTKLADNIPVLYNDTSPKNFKPIMDPSPINFPMGWMIPTSNGMPDAERHQSWHRPSNEWLAWNWTYIIKKSFFDNDYSKYLNYIWMFYSQGSSKPWIFPQPGLEFQIWTQDDINYYNVFFNTRTWELTYNPWLECPPWDPGTPEIPYRAAVPEIPYQPAVAEQLYVPGVPEQPYLAAVPEQPYVPAVPEQAYVPEQVIDCFALKVISTPPIMLAPPRDNVEITLAPKSCVAKSLLYPWKDTIMITIKCHQNTTLRLTGVTNREYKIFDKTPFSQFQTFNPGAKHNHVHQKRLDLKKNQLLAARKLTLSRL